MNIRIDANIYNSVENITKAQSWLLKYQNKLSSNRGMIIKIFFITFVVIILFIKFYK